MGTMLAGSPSLWIDEARALLPSWPACASGEVKCEVLVVGAGIAGCATAFFLQRLGVDVVVVDGHGPGLCASGRNAGFLLLCNVADYPRVREHAGPRAALGLLSLGRRNHELVRDHFAAECDYERSGSWMLADAGDPEAAAELVSAQQALAEDGVACELRTVDHQLAGFARVGVCVPEDGQVHPVKLVAALARRLDRGHAGHAIDVLDLAGNVARAGKTRIRFDHVVVASNAYAPRLVPELSGMIVCHRGQMLATEPIVPRILQPVVYAGRGYDYFRQRSDGVVLVGGRRHLHGPAEATDVSEPSEVVQAALERYARERLPFARSAKITHRWAGIMGFTASGLPLVRTAIAGRGGTLTVLAGFSGHGMGMAIACGELVAAKLAGSPTDEQRRWAALLEQPSLETGARQPAR